MAFFSRTRASEPKAFDADGAPFEATRRSPRQAPRRARVASEHDPDPSSPLDPTEAAKTRARRRLIGAIALALAAIVFVPMLFDRSQAPEVDDIAVQVPDRNSPFEGRKGVPDPSRTPLVPSTALGAPASAPAPIEKDANAPAARTDDAPSVVETAHEAKVAPKEKFAEKAEKPVDKGRPVDAKGIEAKSIEAKDKAAKPTTADDPRALAALEGKTLPNAASSDQAEAGKSFAVQIAAFSAVDRARGLRDQLVSNGLKAYTEPLSTAQGPRTRVRLGPYATRDAAERAKQKLKTMKLDGSIVAL